MYHCFYKFYHKISAGLYEGELLQALIYEIRNI